MSEPTNTHARRGRRTNAQIQADALAQRTAPERTAETRSAPQPRAAGSQNTDHSLVQPEDRGRQTEETHTITRRTRSERSVDTYAVPNNWKKPNWDYQFWVSKVLLQPVEGTTEIWEGGWRPVFWKDVPRPWAPGAKADDQIERGGQQLYLRPMHLTKEARIEEYNAAEQQKRDRIQSAMEGRVSGQEGVADIKGVRPVNLGLEIQGEVGTQSGHTPVR